MQEETKDQKWGKRLPHERQLLYLELIEPERNLESTVVKLERLIGDLSEIETESRQWNVCLPSQARWAVRQF